MSASYFKAAIPEPHRILGQRLKPFSLGHYLILSRFESPFVADEPADKEISRDDLIFAVFACCHEYEEFFQSLNSPNLVQHLRAWGRAIGIFELAPKVQAFWQYYIEGTRAPKFWQEQTPSSTIGAHWSNTMLVTLISKVGYSQQDALNMPFTKTIADYLRYCESEGAVRLMTEEEIALCELVAKEAVADGT